MSFFPILKPSVSGFLHEGGPFAGLAAGVEAPAADFDLSQTIQYLGGALAIHRSVIWQAQTISFAAPSVVAESATVAITGPPIAGAGATLTDTFAFWVQSGNARFAGKTIHSDGTTAAPSIAGASNLGNGISFGAGGIFLSAGGAAQISIGVTSSSFNGNVQGVSSQVFDLGSTSRVWQAAFIGRTFLTPEVQTSGVVKDFEYTAPAHTGRTVSTEIPSVLWDMSAIEQWATGALAAQHFYKLLAPTIAFVGASTVEKTSTFFISGAPIAGANATLTKTLAMLIASGDVEITSKMELDASAVARDTRMLIWDVDNAALERVTVGIADSGGAGFKLLRIPN